MQHLAVPSGPEFPGILAGQRIEVIEALYEAERPVVFTTRSAHDQTLLAYVADESEAGTWYFLAPISQSRLAELREGALTLRDALCSSWLWQCLETKDTLQVWAVEAASVPSLFLPMPGTPLLPEHEAVLVARAVGDEVGLGKVPASVIAFVTDSTRRAVKTLLDYVSNSQGEGRPTEMQRALYDLPVRRLAFASFEVAFGKPDAAVYPSTELKTAVRMLEDGLAWAASPEGEALPARSEGERDAILQAALLLTPPSVGSIVEVQVSGAWMQRGQIRLKRDARKKVRSELRKLKSERVLHYCGRIGEVDRDRCTFILRDTVDHRDRKGIFAEELLDDILQYFTDSRKVAVAGIEREGQFHVTALALHEGE